MQFCFSPLDRNRHTTIDELYKWNDVELFDLDKDPDEMVNLGADNTRNRDLIVPMNAKLEALIKAEIDVDDGRGLPNILPGKLDYRQGELTGGEGIVGRSRS